MTTQKSKKAQITLGATVLDCYQEPNGKYFLSLIQVAESIDMPLKRLSELKALELAQTLYPEGFQESELRQVEGGTRPVKNISLDDASKYWTLAASRQNMKAFLLVAACTAEALERRADSAFGIVRSEEDRNEFIKTRLLGKVKRRTLTDAIKAWIDSHPEQATENYCKFIYSNCSDHLNLVVLGMKAKQARLELECPKGLLRDALPEKALNELASVEEIACRIIEHEGLEPLEAVKKSVTIHYTKTIGIK